MCNKEKLRKGKVKKESIKANETRASQKQIKPNGAFYIRGANSELTFGVNSIFLFPIHTEIAYMPSLKYVI